MVQVPTATKKTSNFSIRAKMIELRKEFTKKGNTYTQVFSNDEAFVYRVTFTKYDGTEGCYFEAFKRKTQKPDIYHEDTYEAYPSDESFGSLAWCYSNAYVMLAKMAKHFSTETCEGVVKAVRG